MSNKLGESSAMTVFTTGVWRKIERGQRELHTWFFNESNHKNCLQILEELTQEPRYDLEITPEVQSSYVHRTRRGTYVHAGDQESHAGLVAFA